MQKKVNLLGKMDLVVWANLMKWQSIRGVSDTKVSACLGVKDLSNRKRSYFMTTKEIGRICELLEIEPEKLFER